jgi:hypothetical protein
MRLMALRAGRLDRTFSDAVIAATLDSLPCVRGRAG